jgi:Cellulose binding domain
MYKTKIIKILSAISILTLIAALNIAGIKTYAKPLSILSNFTFGVSVESEAIPKDVSLVAGPWIVGDWSNTNTSWLNKMNTTENQSKIPYQYTYIMAGKARKDWGLQDCNIGVTFTQTLCYNGANYVRYNKNHINQSYITTANNIKAIFGASREVAIHIEPDFYQYTNSNQNGGGLSYSEAQSALNQWTNSIKQILPNSTLVMDVSPWSNDISKWSAGLQNFDYAGMVGKRFSPNGDGSINAGIDGKTYAQISSQTGKKLILDDSHGAGGYYLTFDYDWTNATLIQARKNDGVAAVILPPNDINTLNTMAKSSVSSQLNPSQILTLPLQTPKVVAVQPSPISPSCTKNNLTVTLTKKEIWQGGFNTIIKVKNIGNSDVYYWNANLTLSPDQKIIATWNLKQYGGQLDPNTSWNMTVKPGQEIEAGGFTLTHGINANLPTVSCNF